MSALRESAMAEPQTTRVYWPTADWSFAEPSSLGFDASKLAALDQIIPSKYGNIRGILLARRGSIAFERYYRGHIAETASHVASVTKSVVSALVGIAIAEGRIADVRQTVLSFFPDYAPGESDFAKRAVTLEHLLTMTAPFAWNAGRAGRLEPLDRLRRQPDWIRFILDILGRNGQIGEFQYCTAGTHLLSAVLTRATGKSAREYANERLFLPVGMRQIPDPKMSSFGAADVFGDRLAGWISDPSGITVGGWGLTMTLRDMARFGFLYLNRGWWDGKSVIPSKWIIDSTTCASREKGYGYLWWIRQAKGLDTFSALGSGGNVICCIPTLDLVIAITSTIIAKPRDRWELIEEHILPALAE